MLNLRHVSSTSSCTPIGTRAHAPGGGLLLRQLVAAVELLEQRDHHGHRALAGCIVEVLLCGAQVGGPIGSQAGKSGHWPREELPGQGNLAVQPIRSPAEREREREPAQLPLPPSSHRSCTRQGGHARPSSRQAGQPGGRQCRGASWPSAGPAQGAAWGVSERCGTRSGPDRARCKPLHPVSTLTLAFTLLSDPILVELRPSWVLVVEASVLRRFASVIASFQALKVPLPLPQRLRRSGDRQERCANACVQWSAVKP